MLYLKSANFEDFDAEYEYVKNIPEDENGFINPLWNISREDFEKFGLQKMINSSMGIDLPEGYVPETFFFLWNEELCDEGFLKKEIVGLFRIRHHLTPALRNGAGHIGYQIKKEYRGQGFATKGLHLAIIEAKKILAKYDETEIFLRCNKTNPASLYVMKKNGAVLRHEDEEHYFTSIT